MWRTLVVSMLRKIGLSRGSCWGVFVMVDLIGRFVRNESGATAIEYGLIAGLISIVIITAVTLVGGNLTTVFTGVANAL